MAVSFTTEEKDQLALAFERLEVKPKFDDPESLSKWMKEFTEATMDVTAKVKTERADDQANKAPRRIYVNPPRIAPFSGSQDSKEIAYESWKYEVLTLLREDCHSRTEVATAAKKSLRGEAAVAVRHLGIDADLNSILKKLDGIYGLVEHAEDLMEKFYAAKQRDGESVASWSCRLEDLLSRASFQKHLPGSANDMLTSKFFGGLLPRFKEPARVKVEHITDFDVLRIEVRKIECEQAISDPVKENKKAQVKMTNADSDDVKGILQQISSRLDKLETKMDNPSSTPPIKTDSSRSYPSDQRRGNWNRGQGRGHGNSRGKQYSGGSRWNNRNQGYNQAESEDPFRSTAAIKLSLKIGAIAIGATAYRSWLSSS